MYSILLLHYEQLLRDLSIKCCSIPKKTIINGWFVESLTSEAALQKGLDGVNCSTYIRVTAPFLVFVLTKLLFVELVYISLLGLYGFC